MNIQSNESMPRDFRIPQNNENNSASEVKKLNETGASLPIENETAHRSDAKTRVKRLLSQNHKNVQQAAAELKDQFADNPSIQQKIERFEQKYAKNMETIRNQSWSELKRERGIGMTRKVGDEPVSMDEFRTAANALVEEITAEIGEELGLDKVTWSASGTVGYNSDVDTVLIPSKEGIGKSDICLYKSIRDLVHVFVFGAPSGTQLDTESYIPHPSELRTRESLSNGSNALSRYQTHELANVVIQRFESLKRHPEEYERSKEKDLKGISDTELRAVMHKLYSQVECFMGYMDSLINEKVLEQHDIPTEQLSDGEMKEIAGKIMKENPRAYKNAREAVILPLRISLAEECGRIEEKFLAKLALLGEKAASSSDVSEMDELLLELNKGVMLLALMQDEGTHSQAEGKATLFQEEGQIHMAAKGKAPRKIDPRIHEERSLHRRLVRERQNPIAEVLFVREIRKDLTPKGFEKPTPETLILASYEESAQFEHVINEGLRRKAGGKLNEATVDRIGSVAIDSGKYCLRTVRNNVRALEMIKNSYIENDVPLPRWFGPLMSRARKLEFQAAQLERCKRKATLNKVAAEEMLVKIFVEDMKMKGLPADEPRIRSDVSKVLDLFEYGGKYDNVPLKRREILDLMMTELEKKGYIETADLADSSGKVKRLPKDVEVRKILQARAGYKKERAHREELLEMHNEADSITISALGLTSEKRVREFANDVITLGQDVRNMAIEEGLVPRASLREAEQLDLMSLVYRSASKVE